MYLLVKFPQQCRRNPYIQWWAYFDFRVSIDHHFVSIRFFGGEAISKKYLLHISSVYGIKYLDIFFTNTFNDSTDCENM